MSSTRKVFHIREILCSLEYSHRPRFDIGIQYQVAGYDGDDRMIILSLFWTIYFKWHLKYLPESSQYGFRINSNWLEIDYGKQDIMEMRGNIFILNWSSIINFFLGKEYRGWTNERYEGTHQLVMDYGDFYNVRVERKTLLAVRPRIFFGRKLWTSWNLTPDRGIPHSGKGENSWDCGDDATYEMSIGDCIDANDALNKMKKSCERDRQRYGMASNIPMAPLPKLKVFGDSEPVETIIQ